MFYNFWVEQHVPFLIARNNNWKMGRVTRAAAAPVTYWPRTSSSTSKEKSYLSFV